MNIKHIVPKLKVPSWLSLAVGYGADGMFGGEENIAKDLNGNITFSRTDILRHRQWYVSPDIDWTKIKTDKKALKFIFAILNAFKFPAPSLELSGGKLKARAIVF
jgi:hypothetical protein